MEQFTRDDFPEENLPREILQETIHRGAIFKG